MSITEGVEAGGGEQALKSTIGKRDEPTKEVFGCEVEQILDFLRNFCCRPTIN
jgi:hypothetical protein